MSLGAWVGLCVAEIFLSAAGVAFTFFTRALFRQSIKFIAAHPAWLLPPWAQNEAQVDRMLHNTRFPVTFVRVLGAFVLLMAALLAVAVLAR